MVVHATSVHKWDDVRIFQKQAKSLAEAGYAVHIVAPGDLRDQQASCNGTIALHLVPRLQSRFGRMLVTAPRVICKAIALGADVLHIHDLELIPWALAAKLFGYRVIVDLHEDYPAAVLSKSWIPTPLRPLFALAVGCLIGLAAHTVDAVIAADEHIERQVQSRASCCLVRTVENFPDLSRFMSTSGGASRTRFCQPTVLFLGGVNPARAILPFVQALPLLGAIPYRVQVGGRAGHPALLARLQQEPGWKFVEYLGEVPHDAVPDLLSRCALSVVLFTDEPNHQSVRSNRVFEALAAGAPVLVSNMPAWTTFIADNDCGFAADPTDEQSIATALRNALLDPQRLEEAGLNGRRAVERQFSWCVQAETLVAVYSLVARVG